MLWWVWTVSAFRRTHLPKCRTRRHDEQTEIKHAVARPLPTADKTLIDLVTTATTCYYAPVVQLVFLEVKIGKLLRLWLVLCGRQASDYVIALHHHHHHHHHHHCARRIQPRALTLCALQTAVLLDSTARHCKKSRPTAITSFNNWP